MAARSQSIIKSTALPKWTGSYLGLKVWGFLGGVLVNLLALTLLGAYLFPMSYMFVTSVKSDKQFLDIWAPILPADPKTFEYEGETYNIYNVTTDEGKHHWALVKPGKTESTFIDPAHPENGTFQWQGNWRILRKVYVYRLHWENLTESWNFSHFPLLIKNTLFLALVTEIGVMISSVAVAYGFSRFPLPGGKWLFILLIGSIIIPEKITLIPTYMLNLYRGWVGTYLPIIAPLFFGNAVFIFLLRQNFKSIPKDLDEAAMLDGAGPGRILLSVILPQSYPTVITVALLHFFYIWNETRLASLYLGTRRELYTIGYGVQTNQGFGVPPSLLQASTLLVMIVPVVVLFLSQRVFMHRVLVTGTEK